MRFISGVNDARTYLFFIILFVTDYQTYTITRLRCKQATSLVSIKQNFLNIIELLEYNLNGNKTKETSYLCKKLHSAYPNISQSQHLVGKLNTFENGTINTGGEMRGGLCPRPLPHTAPLPSDALRKLKTEHLQPPTELTMKQQHTTSSIAYLLFASYII